MGNVTKFQAAHSQTASLAIAGTAVAALTAGGRKVGANITAMCEMCCIPWYTSISGRCGGNDELVDLHKGTRFFGPRSAWSRISSHLSLALNVGHVCTSEKGSRNRFGCNQLQSKILTDCFICLPASVITQIAMFLDEDVAPQLGMWAFQTSNPWLVILVIATWQALGNVKPTRVRQFCCEREACVFLGHVVKDHAFGCAGPCGVLGKLIILLESNRILHLHFKSLQQNVSCRAAGCRGWLWAIHWFPQQHTDIYLAQTRVSSSLTSSLAWIFRWFCWRFLSVLEKNDCMLWATGNVLGEWTSST